MHLISLFFISSADRVGNPFSHGRFLSPQVVKELSLVLSFDPPGGKKVRKEWRRTAVAPSDDFYGITTAVRYVCESTD